MTLDARNALVETHLPLVRSIALRLKSRLPRQVDFDDLCSAGYLGLLDAAARFDETRTVEFGSFARIRVHGAMLDHLRSIDPLPRPERERWKKSGSEYPAPGEVSLEAAAEITEPGKPADQLRMREQLRLLLSRLSLETMPERYRLVLRLLYQDEWSCEQISQRLGCHITRVYAIHKEALFRLRRRLEEQGIYSAGSLLA